MDRYVLKIKEGKIVKVRKFPEGLRLCAVDTQNALNNEPPVEITVQTNGSNRMALKFQYKNVSYFLKVEGEELALDSSQNTSDCYWFEKVNMGSGEHYGLRSVAAPLRYLSLPSARKTYLILSKKPEECVLVVDERIEKSITS